MKNRPTLGRAKALYWHFAHFILSADGKLHVIFNKSKKMSGFVFPEGKITNISCNSKQFRADVGEIRYCLSSDIWYTNTNVNAEWVVDPGTVHFEREISIKDFTVTKCEPARMKKGLKNGPSKIAKGFFHYYRKNNAIAIYNNLKRPPLFVIKNVKKFMRPIFPCEFKHFFVVDLANRLVDLRDNSPENPGVIAKNLPSKMIDYSMGPSELISINSDGLILQQNVPFKPLLQSINQMKTLGVHKFQEFEVLGQIVVSARDEDELERTGDICDSKFVKDILFFGNTDQSLIKIKIGEDVKFESCKSFLNSP